jgi:hypothetical protein
VTPIGADVGNRNSERKIRCLVEFGMCGVSVDKNHEINYGYGVSTAFNLTTSAHCCIYGSRGQGQN